MILTSIVLAARKVHYLLRENIILTICGFYHSSRWEIFSSFGGEVKTWDDETDMKKLEEAVRSVEMPALFWGASKLVPVPYGINKLTIMLTIVDHLVSVNSLMEEPCNGYIQSCEVVGFNKI
ncbi:EF1_GNE domain-containing protein [Cephalotus follicularis]|uniref:EF1_GNE domain-containing protein n=1 Tax=Cephalotus follicularis TaxID=3775 RepID=A0A1Q3B2I6_CEPFO|nr:EF1_GNE domain-containing protein [Cephalotus follicularis]